MQAEDETTRQQTSSNEPEPSAIFQATQGLRHASARAFRQLHRLQRRPRWADRLGRIFVPKWRARRELEAALAEVILEINRNIELLRWDVARVSMQLRSVSTPPAGPRGATSTMTGEPTLAFETSRLCVRSDFEMEFGKRWMREMHLEPRYHRKVWEHIAILQAAQERDLLRPSRRAVGFGVGAEPLPALFAKFGVEVIATDLDPDSPDASAWSQSGQHVRGRKSALNPVCGPSPLCPPDTFDANVTFLNADMRRLDHLAIPDESVDFVWSSCALEHLGSLSAGLEFVEESLRFVRPGGYALHTTECNLSNAAETLDHGQTVLYRPADLAAFFQRLARGGHAPARLDFSLGSDWMDFACDMAPYADGVVRPHLKVMIGEYVCTSIILIIRKRD